MIEKILFILFGVYFIYLWYEASSNKKYRSSIKHVIYVNGTRGKSSVTRLIYSGLRAGGWRTYGKTTGTLPMIINTKGEEKLIKRRGRANIKEQLAIVKSAALENAEILVIECMAVDPELQYISQNRMVKSDIGVITNVRPDHIDVMGKTLNEIGKSLCNTIPKKGICFTADEKFFPRFKDECERQNCKPFLTMEGDVEFHFDFQENIALALSVCSYLGVEKEKALEGMKSYQRDPYALSFYKLKNGAIFIGGLSINDPVSTEMVYRRVIKDLNLKDYKLTLLISNRLDRGYRTLQHQELAKALDPHAIWIIGSNSKVMVRDFNKKIPNCPVTILKTAKDAPFNSLGAKDVVFAIGNIGEGGKAIMERVKKEGETICITK